MKTRRKSVVAMTVLGMLGLLGSSAFADPVYVGTVELDLGTPYQIGYGGEFTAHLNFSTPGSVANQLQPVALTSAGASNESSTTTAVFETFCIEEGIHDVTFNPGHQYYFATIGDNDGLPQTIADGTAYLFDQFWHGTLTGYNFTNTGPGLSRQLDAGALQTAIWYLEGDNSVDGAAADAGISGNVAAVAQANAWIALAAGKGGGLHPPVQVFGMYNTLADAEAHSSNGLAQAQLVEIPSVGTTSIPPVPLPASVGVGFSMLGGFGGLFAFRKRMSRRARIA